MLQTFNQNIDSNVVLDTGILIEYLFSDKGDKINDMIFQNDFITNVFVSPLTLIEIYYITRRKSSLTRTKTMLDKIRKITTIFSLDTIIELIGEIKASTSFSLADSSNIAIAEDLRIPVIFKHEKEIEKVIKLDPKNKYINRIIFIDDFSYFKKKIVRSTKKD